MILSYFCQTIEFRDTYTFTKLTKNTHNIRCDSNSVEKAGLYGTNLIIYTCMR